jgi:Zn-dependent M28 family amino/carboxypeptidase
VKRRNLAGILFVVAVQAAPVKQLPEPYTLAPGWTAALKRISADSLRGHLSFIASDLLEGRNTPSPGLEIAAEYIAAQFRRAGLEGAAKNGYFQIAEVEVAGKPVHVKNVAAILRGSDPKLRDTYVVLSAHYDHLGLIPTADGDRVYNGANDDGSGTVSVIEIAAALAGSRVRPRRSILFLTFFGEEEGLLGSTYFVEHPLVPLENIVAQLNLEQLGRTDDPAGPQVRRLGVTGVRYSDVGHVLEMAGVRTGVEVHGDNLDPDEYFERSDNLAFAIAGIPSHTLGTAFEFPDYHRPSDEWEKIDFDNMATVDRTVAAALVMLADSTSAPQWSRTVGAAQRYRRAPTSQPR